MRYLIYTFKLQKNKPKRGAKLNSGQHQDEYMENEHYQAAWGFELLEIGEYINRLSEEFIQKHSDIDWSGFICMRVIHAHHYEGIILDLVWDAIKVDVPELKKYVEKILNEW